MKRTQIETPEISDAAVKAKTGKTLKAWFAELDQAGGLETGRRELVNAIYEAANKDTWWSVTLVVEYERAKGQKRRTASRRAIRSAPPRRSRRRSRRVFAAFGDAPQLDRWLGPKTVLDFKEGGSFSNGDGDRGTFKKILANKDIKLTWESEKLAPGTAVEVLFADKVKGKTGITLNHTRIQSRRDADRVREAWSAALEQLKTLLEKA